MLLHCPSCFTGYDVPDRCGGRRLRCAHCGAEWRPPLPEVEPPVTSDPIPLEGETDTGLLVDDGAFAEPDPDRLDDGVVKTEPERHERSSTRRYRPVLALSACWMLSLSVMGGGAYAAMRWRDTISHHWPPSQRIYALMPTA